MNYRNNKVTDINIAYIGGGSKLWAWSLMSDLALEKSLSGNIKLYDIDFKKAKDNELIGNMISEKKESKGKWNYKAVKTLKEALINADFVILSILPGTFKEMYSDVHVPEKYGINQSVGDTVGPGGIMRALRTIPIYIEFANSIKKHCPFAWVINYTNPMSLCTRTLYHEFPEIKAFGCCHEVFSTQELLMHMLKDLRDIDIKYRDEIKINLFGINHFTWINYATYKDINLFPLYQGFVEKYYETGYEGIEPWTENVFSSAHRVKFDLFKRYGLIAAAGDRHLVEFLPSWYLKDKGTIKNWKFHLTSIDWRINNSKEKEKKANNIIRKDEDIHLKPSGEEGVNQIKALLGLEDKTTNINLPNKGQVKNLPENIIIETNALIRKNSINPIYAGEIPEKLNNIISMHVYNQETVLQAAINKDKELAFKAFINDPLVNLSIDDSKKLFNEMLFNIKEYLPDWDI